MDLKGIDAWKSEFFRLSVLDGLIRLLFGAAALAILILWADHLFSLPQFERWLLFAAYWGALAAGIHIWLLVPWLTFDWGKILDAAAHEFPQLKDYLRPAWELSRGNQDRYTSERLKQAHRERTEALLDDLPKRPVFPLRLSAAAGRLGALALLAALTLPWLKASPSWERVAAPWRDMPLEKFLRVSPGDAVLDWGKAAAITVAWTEPSVVARDRRELKLWLKGPGGWASARWDNNSGSMAGFTVSQLTSALPYYVSWRDLRSRTYSLTPAALPQLDSITATLHGPNPVAIPLNSVEPLSLRSGLWVTFKGRPNQPLAQALLRVMPAASPISAIPLKALPSGDYEAGLLVREDAGLRFELQSADGRRDPSPVLYALRALADQPPVIELLSPVIALQASPADTIPIIYRARDDAGLSRLTLLLRSRAGEREIPLQRFTGRLEFLGDHPLELAALGHGKIEFRLKAYDNAASAQSGVSQKGSIEIVDFESAHAQMENLWRKTQDRLKSLGDKQERARSLSAAQKSQELEAEQAGLAEAWKESVGLLSELSSSMERDVYANPGLSQQARELAEDLEQSRRRGLPSALASGSAGDFKEAEKMHAGLSSQVKKAARLLDEGRRLQDLQDFYTQASRMSQNADAMQSALDAMANKEGGKASSPGAMGKLSSALSRLQQQMQSLQKAIEALPQVDAQSAEAMARKTYTLALDAARQSADALSRALSQGDLAQALRQADQLSQELAQIQKALAQAAAGEEASGMARQAAERMEKAQALWSEVVGDQSQALEKTQKLGERHLGRKLQAQKELLAELSREQGVLIDTAASRGPWFPGNALAEMRAVKAEFDARQVRDSDKWLRSISASLRFLGAIQPSEASGYEWFALGEDKIRGKLEQGPAVMDETPGEESAAAARGQGDIRRKTGRLQGVLESIAAQLAPLPRAILQKVEGAQGEQAEAERALQKGDSSRARTHQENTLSLLNQGNREMSQLAGGQKNIQAALGRPFGRRATGVRTMGSGGMYGTQIGLVELPSAKDYLPPKEIRQELEKSLQENRPGSYDGIIKEYFKRIAQ
ncbi:MAG: hypothetical protein A3J74_01680 [Elusimicrobia bacterium RIFCSPHIGHO2_02_FULL_57_9]|nr:MAG: hypothetical protein A3J74_01680 [Elusimicrobia bacterium RIFCSPHIGHO2_02_FULL_57_9]